ncbi:DUF998 domain-containing protein [Microbacterium sp. CH12i]|uniref:DUF998 domain-containing protein n=1 Tax=Microbacterium sp. CH12i TaxID=1479651 RepID=UPI00068AAE7C|nr:DUF998 domain-containing protein [Microbacterium sp. CH12i]
MGKPRPIAGDGSVGMPVAAVAGVIAAASFVVSTFLHRRGQNASMPRWQATISALSAVALTIAFAGVTALGVLLASEVLGVGLQGLQLSPLGGGLLAGVASALAGRLTFAAGIGLRTADLAALLFSYLVIGTLFAMITAADPRWWERNFSQLGIGAGAWAFNGTLLVAGILTATVGSYIGRDLHRIRGDSALSRIAWVVVLWAATGVALAAIGLFPLERSALLHNIAAFSTLILFVAAGVITTLLIPGPPRPLLLTTIGIALLLVVACVLAFGFRLFAITVLEAVVIGLGLLWLTTLVRILAVLTPAGSRPSARRSLMRG